MASQVRFTATKVPIGKKGKLTPDENGYFELCIGALNTFNSANEYYVYEGARDLFESSSPFMRRVKTGNLKSELGHPKWTSGMTEQDFIDRMFIIEEKNTCAHIADVWLDPNYGRSHPALGNPRLVAIMAKVKPAGPHGNVLLESLQNPLENVCFSIRALTADYMERGQKYRCLNTIFTFDCVTEPGIGTSNKWDSPALEELGGFLVTRKQIEHVAYSNSLCALESSRALAIESLEAFSPKYKNPPIYTKW
jgi:hypothetical protein